MKRDMKGYRPVGLVMLWAWALTASLWAGGFQLTAEIPEGSNRAEVQNAALLVRTFGCHQPQDASVTVMAEGMINGRRESKPVKLTPTSQPGVYAITQQWPAEGLWVLAINGHLQSLNSSMIVELGPQGKVLAADGQKIVARGAYGKLSAKDIERALQSLAAKIARNTQAAGLVK